MEFKVSPLFMCFSAGVGRSGTFVTLLWLMQLCARGIRPDIRAAVEDLRLHRMWMVQNLVSPVLTLTCSCRRTIQIFELSNSKVKTCSSTSKSPAFKYLLKSTKVLAATCTLIITNIFNIE